MCVCEWACVWSKCAPTDVHVRLGKPAEMLLQDVSKLQRSHLIFLAQKIRSQLEGTSADLPFPCVNTSLRRQLFNPTVKQRSSHRTVHPAALLSFTMK